ncbi:preprotein translocase subunit SecE [Candidatus Dependentiae bacterium]|nr:preprotein translocase subunit SecE [Candidatus Dependentiae bacterium]
MSKIIAFFQEVRTELEKVTWPKRDDLVGAVVIVCILSLVFAAILGFMDSAITVAIHWLIR